MMQLDFDLSPPLARATDPIESFQAADAAADFIKSQERLIVSVLAEHGELGVDGIAARCGLLAHAVGKRMVALERNGRIELTGRVVLSASGRSQREWRVA